MKKILFIFLILNLCIIDNSFAYFTKANFAGGVIASSDILADAEGDGATFDVTMNEGAGDFPNSLTRVIVFTSTCGTPGKCAAKEILETDAASCSGTYPTRVCTLTIQTRNVEDTSHPGGDWVAGSKVELVNTAGMEQEQEAAIDGKLATAGTDNVKDTHIDWGTGANQVSADDIPDGSTNAIPTLTQESNWDTAYGWGDHSGVGYLTSESDPKVGTLTNTKWCSTDGSQVICNEDVPAGMSYPGAGVSVSTGSGWDTSLSTDGSGDCASGAVCLGDHTHSGYQAGDSDLTTIAGLTPVQYYVMCGDATPAWSACSSLSIATLNMSSSTSSIPWLSASSCSQTTEGQSCWDNDGDFLTIGDGASTLTFLPVNTKTDTKYCTYDATNSEIDCNSEGGSGYTNLTSFVDQTAWRVFYSNTDGDITELALGADGTYLKSNGATSAPTFATPSGSGDVTGVGDCASGACLDGTSDGGTNIAIYDGDSHKVTIDVVDIDADATLLLGKTYTDTKWCSYSSSAGLTCNQDTPGGGVGGSTGSIDNALIRADGTGGSTIQACPTTCADTTGALTIPKQDGVAGSWLFYEANSTDTNGMGWLGPDSRSTDVYLKLPDTDPSEGQSLSCGTPAGGVSTCTWITALSTASIDTFSELDTIVADKSLVNKADGAVWSGEHDFGGATSIEIVNGSAPTVNAAGEIAIDTTADQIKYYGGAERVLSYKQTLSMVIPSVADTDDMLIMKAPYGMTMLAIDCIVSAATSATINIQECASDGTSCVDTATSDLACTTTGANTSTFTDAIVDSGDWIKLDIPSISGTPGTLTITVTFSVIGS